MQQGRRGGGEHRGHALGRRTHIAQAREDARKGNAFSVGKLLQDAAGAMLSCMDVPWLEVCKAGKGADHTEIIIVYMGAGALQLASCSKRTWVRLP